MTEDEILRQLMEEASQLNNSPIIPSNDLVIQALLQEASELGLDPVDNTPTTEDIDFEESYSDEELEEEEIDPFEDDDEANFDDTNDPEGDDESDNEVPDNFLAELNTLASDSKDPLLVELLNESLDLSKSIQSTPPVIKKNKYTVYYDYLLTKEVELTDQELEDGYILCDDDTYVTGSGVYYNNGEIYNRFLSSKTYGYMFETYYPHIEDSYVEFVEVDKDLNEILRAKGSTRVLNNLTCYYIIPFNAYILKTKIPSILKLIEDTYDKDRYLQAYKLEIVDYSAIKTNFLKEFPFAEETLNSIYKDHWDIIFEDVSYNKPMLVIKFDEITIRNSYNNSHKIFDLYTALVLDTSDPKHTKFTTGLKGGRGILSLEERDKSYCHSHLNMNWDILGQFCTGSGPIVSYIVNFNQNPDVNTFFSVLYNIKILVEWESLEGTPHRKMSSIGAYTINQDTPVEFNLDEVYGKLLLDDNIPIINTMVNGKSDFEVESTILEEILVPYLKDQHESCTVYKEESTQVYIAKSSSRSVATKSTLKLLTFRGEDIYTEVKNLNIINENELKKVAHPYITRQLSNEILRRVRDYYFKEDTSINS